MLGRSVARQREMAVRRSLGGSRLRILRMLLSEALVLSLLASGAAFLFTLWVSHAVVKLIPPIESGARLRPDLTPDWTVVAYATALAACSALAFMLAPSLRLWRQELLPWLKAGEHGVAQGRSRLANVLVVLQLALCVVLLTGAGLASRSVHLIGTADLGFRKDHLLIARVSTSGAAVTEQQNLALLEHLRERLAAVPGVLSISYASAVPPSPWGQWTDSVRAAGSTHPIMARGLDAGPDYLAVLGVRPLVGSGISKDDVASARKYAVITRHVAETLWAGQSAVGRMAVVGHEPFMVAGVVPDAAFSGIGAEAQPNFVFLPERAGADRPGMRFFHLRYSGDPRTTELVIRAAIRQVDARVPVSQIETMEAELEDYTAPAILIAGSLGCFSIGSLLIAAIGLYAVVAFHTARRTRDFGIRIALGASPQRILGQVLREGLLLATSGTVIGLVLSRAAGRALHSVLYGLSPTDGVTYASVLALLAVISLTACYVPARGAARTDPMHALRED
ncbi:MAG TPA: FtsX-like permease family protein [Bryobacteraceae bacterium]|nr:FtsX-like permease family protein [Bryobacteraceae bacterium]